MTCLAKDNSAVDACVPGSKSDRHHLARRAVFVVPVLIYFFLVLCGITTSSIGISTLRENPSAPHGVQFGASQAIRSDEYGTESPIWLGQIARNGGEAVTPLSVSGDFFAQLPSGPASSVVFFDGTLLNLSKWVPSQMLFAAKWWLPSLMLFLGLPIFFRQVTGRLRWGYLASVLIFMAPANTWWSGRPVNTLGFVAAGCAIAIYGSSALCKRSWIQAALAFIISGILLARTPSYYQPLAIVLSLPLVFATAIYLLVQAEPLRIRIISLLATAMSGLIWTGLVFLENWNSIVSGLGTVYPGDRQSSGDAITFGKLFGATNYGWLKYLGHKDGVNETELATAYTFLLIIMVILFISSSWKGTRPQKSVLVVFTGFAFFWLSWATIDWGSLGQHFPLLNRVPNTRASQGVGFIAIIAFCLYVDQWRKPHRIWVAIVAGVTAAFITGYSGSLLSQTTLPSMTSPMIWTSSLLTGLIVFVIINYPHKWISIGAALIGGVLISVSAQPVLIGLGDLRASSSARDFMRWGTESRAQHVVWASDSQAIDSLMTATGTPSLSYRQQIGPNRAEWLKLDPHGSHSDMWNRGGLHITFNWTDSAKPQISFSQPYPDVVEMSVSPCVLAKHITDLRHVVSLTPLQGSCLSYQSKLLWSGSQFYIYTVSSGDNS